MKEPKGTTWTENFAAFGNLYILTFTCGVYTKSAASECSRCTPPPKREQTGMKEVLIHWYIRQTTAA